MRRGVGVRPVVLVLLLVVAPGEVNAQGVRGWAGSTVR